MTLSDLGLIDLRQGRIDSAKQKLFVAQTMLPEIIEANKTWATRAFDYFQGEVFLSMGDFENAIAVYKKIIPDNPGSFQIEIVVHLNIPFLDDGLARAYQQKGDIPNAIAEYEKQIGSGLKNRLRLIHPKLHYRLAKLYQETGEKEKAISEYKRFLDLWKEADKNLPELIDAKARHANLIGAK